MDPDQTAPIHCLLESLLKHFSRQQKQTTFVVIGLLSVKLYIKKSSRLGNFPQIAF